MKKNKNDHDFKWFVKVCNWEFDSLDQSECSGPMDLGITRQALAILLGLA